MHSESPPPRTRSSVVVRPMDRSDLGFATSLHLQSLNHGLFPALGSSFLKAYLGTFVSSPSALALIAEKDGAPVGFVVGTLDDRAHYGHVVRHCGLKLVPRAAVSLVVRPKVALRFIRTRAFRYARGAVRLAGTKPTQAAASFRDAVLTHMAVEQSARSQGVGQKLALAFVEQVRNSDADGVAVTTRSGSAGAARFYEKLGWRSVGEFLDRDGLGWQRLRLDLGRS